MSLEYKECPHGLYFPPWPLWGSLQAPRGLIGSTVAKQPTPQESRMTSCLQLQLLRWLFVSSKHRAPPVSWGCPEVEGKFCKRAGRSYG